MSAAAASVDLLAGVGSTPATSATRRATITHGWSRGDARLISITLFWLHSDLE